MKSLINIINKGKKNCEAFAKRAVRYASENKAFVTMLVAVFFILVSSINNALLTDWDECIYAEYGANMKQNANFLVNYWNPSTPSLEKLPFYSDLLQVPYLFGVNEFTSRILTVLFSCALLFVLYEFAKKYFSKTTALLSVLIFMTGEVFVRYSFRVNTDIGFTLFIIMGIFAWLLSSEKGKNYLAYISGLLFGLAVLIKGPSIVVFLAVIAFSILFEKNKSQRIYDFIKLCCALLIVAVPWHVYLYAVFGDQFIHTYFYENLIQKVKYPVEFHFEGRAYYLKLLVKEFFPWIAALLLFPLIALKNHAPKNPIEWLKNVFFKESVFNFYFYLILGMTIFEVLLLSKAATRIAWYLMPIYPFIAILIGRAIDVFAQEFLSKKWRGYVLTILTVLLILDGGSLLLREVNYGKYVIPTPREQASLEAQKLPQKKLNYLVQFSERQGRAALPKENYTSVTWRFGGNPCAKFYTGKDTNYFYNPEEFVKSIKKNNDTVYLINNGDLKFVEMLQSTVLYKNTDYTLFTL